MPTIAPGDARGVRKNANSPAIRCCGVTLLLGFGKTGHPNRSPEHCGSATRRGAGCGCHTRRFTSHCSCSHVACSPKSCRSIFDPGGRSVAACIITSPVNGGLRSRMRSRSPNAQPRLKIARFPAIGRETFSLVEVSLRSPLSLSVRHGSLFLSRSMGAT